MSLYGLAWSLVFLSSVIGGWVASSGWPRLSGRETHGTDLNLTWSLQQGCPPKPGDHEQGKKNLYFKPLGFGEVEGFA